MFEREILSAAERKWAYEKWCVGYTLEQIAEALRVNPQTVGRTFSRHGLEKARPVLLYPGALGDRGAHHE